MTPFKEKPVKWQDKDSATGRYKNVNGYKFDIVKQTVVIQQEEMPKHFLADTPEEAEALYSVYSGLLNGMSYNYAVATGLQKVDLFGDALIGLGRAYRDWDPKRSDDFKIYAIYRIKDALNEFVRDNMASVRVPAYIKKSHTHVTKLKSIFHKYDVSTDKVLLCGLVDSKIKGADKKECELLVKYLADAAVRAKVGYKKFIERVEYIPENCEINDAVSNSVYEESLETALVIKKLQTYMDKTELVICKGVMEGISYEVIGQEFNKSSVWVKRKLNKLRDKIIAS